MSKAYRAIGLTVLILAAVPCVLGQDVAGTMAFTVSMDQPAKHYYHVEFRCDGLKGDTQDFKMPVWMPGYYRIMDYPRHVTNFKAVELVVVLALLQANYRLQSKSYIEALNKQIALVDSMGEKTFNQKMIGGEVGAFAEAAKSA